ncbi:hypothetical protein [Burkholderia diffusa]|uniref:hypothetical protein n=1 Tax=Burkholderia diffusa TaxID=488732 RepID=UPI0007562ACD|nr:hypothetical protein [Burkholderia diffusa]KVG33877.1 hypothetical protein WJ30_07350 [Burkholderia diffusa]
MADSSTNIDQISSTQANKELTMNALTDAASPAMLWGRRASTSSGLTWGYYGGRFVDGTGTAHAINNGTITVGASTTTYIYADNVTGAVSSNTTGFPAGKVPLYSVVSNASQISSWLDYRSYQPSAVAAAAASGVGLAGGAVQTAAYTFVAGDKGQCLVMNSASAVSQALPSPGGTGFGAQWWASAENIGTGTMTLTVPSGVSLDGVVNGTLGLTQNQGLTFFTDGSNYFTIRGLASGGFTNPMSAVGDMIIGGMAGAATRLAAGSAGQVLTMVSGSPAWAAASGGTSAPATANMDLVSYFVGSIAASQTLMKAVTPQPLTLPSGLTGSYAYCDTAPTGSISCTINKISGGSTTAIGSVNFAAGATTGTFTFSSAVTTAAGDVVQVVAPSVADATFAGPQIGLAGTIPVNAGAVAVQTSAYTFQPTDRNALNVMNNAGATSSALPTPTGTSGNYPNGWRTKFSNIGAGTATLTVPSGLSLDGVTNGTIVLSQYQSVGLWTDGTNWFSTRGKGGGGGSSISQGAFGSRGAAGTAGNMYVSNDSLVESVDTGSAWVDYERGLKLTRPVLVNFTQVNAGGSTLTQSAYSMIFAENNSGSTTDQCRLAEISPPASGSWTITMRAEMSHAFLSGFPRFGLYARDSATGNIAAFWFAPWGRWYAYETYAGPTSWSARTSLNGSNGGYTDLHKWHRLQYDGTNFKFFISNDGLNFVQLYSVSATAWLTHAPTGCGIAINPSGLNYAMNVLSFTATTP